MDLREKAESDPFVVGYVKCMLWCSSPLSADEGDDTSFERLNFDACDALTDDAVKQVVEDCDSFRELAGDLLEGFDESQAGHDFWLTRNGHGAGFWDGDYGDVGDDLTKIAKPFGEQHLDFVEGFDYDTCEPVERCIEIL